MILYRKIFERFFGKDSGGRGLKNLIKITADIV
jgi:hypothetical protein